MIDGRLLDAADARDDAGCSSPATVVTLIVTFREHSPRIVWNVCPAAGHPETRGIEETL
jgi:hypothetical protein